MARRSPAWFALVLLGAGLASCASGPSVCMATGVSFHKEPCERSTALCRDGGYSHSQTRQGTCSYHGGVAKWLGTLDYEGRAAPQGPEEAE